MPKPSKQQISTRHGGMTTESAGIQSILAEYAALRYDYGAIPSANRQTVQDAAVDIRRRQRRVMEDLLAIGRRLLEVKELLPHGEFGDWIEMEFELSERVAQGMMNAARVYSDEAKARRVALLSDGAIYLLVAPSTPEAARSRVEAIIEQTGKAPTRAEVQQIIDEAKAQAREIPVAFLEAPTNPMPEPQTRMVEVQMAQTLDVLLPALDATIAHADHSLITHSPITSIQMPEGNGYAIEYGAAISDPFDAWLSLCPATLTLRQRLAIFELAKRVAVDARREEPRLHNAVTNALPIWSQLIIMAEKILK